MSNVYAVRSFTLHVFEHVQNSYLASAYNKVYRRMSAYLERTRRISNVYLHMRAYDHTLVYANAIRCSVTALSDTII